MLVVSQKKLYYYLSQLNKDIENYKSYGWSIPKPSLNWKLFIKKKDQEISRLNRIYEGILSRNKIDIINGTAQFLNSQKIKVGKKTYQAKNLLFRLEVNQEFQISPKIQN